MDSPAHVQMLQEQIDALQRENARLRAAVFEPGPAPIVRCPPPFAPLFDRAAARIREHFAGMQIDPARAMIGIGDERYVLIRASAFSLDFLDTLVSLYADRGPREALTIGRGFLFDIAHTIGFHDARTLHKTFGSEDPIEKLSHGPVHFAYTGWSLVDIKPVSNPVPNDDYCLVYEHPYSFEAASWLRVGRVSEGPVCIMNSGYSSGWCEASFGLELTAVEVTCKARGDACCSFVMAPPHRVAERVREHFGIDIDNLHAAGFDVPSYFQRKRVEEDLRESLRKLEDAQDELVRKERLATVGLLVAGVAHEVNTPLGVAMTASSVVSEELDALRAKFDAQQLTRADLRGFLDRAGLARELVRSNLDRAAAQVTNFKRVSVDHVSQQRRRIDVGEYLRQTLDSLRPVLRRAALELALDIDTSPGEIDTVPGALAQILTNFITNTAAHARDAAGSNQDDLEPVRVELRVRREPDCVRLTYRDHGQGMSEAVRRQAFQPFFTTARGAGGSGLGLHIVHSLVVDVLGGRIDLTTAPGQGVCFEIEFPVR
jgi:two-component system cell cycle sensor histidine kinase/response regulator CckA